MFAESRSAGEQLLLTVSGSVPLTELEDLALGLLHLSLYKMGNLTDSVCPVLEGLKNPFFYKYSQMFFRESISKFALGEVLKEELVM